MTALNRRSFLYLTGGAAVAAAIGGCSSEEETPTGGKADGGAIKFWHGYAITDPEKKTKKPADFWIYQAAERFTAKTGTRVELEALPGDATMFTKIRTASLGNKGPDVASVWSGSYMLSIKDFLEPTRRYFSDEERKALSGWPAVTDGFNPEQGGEILGVPNGSDGAYALLFSKDVMAKAGVDTSAWPIRFDAWLGELEKIKRSGLTPLAIGKFGYVFFTYDTWLAQTVGGPVGIGDLASGKRKFSDPDILDTTEKWLRLRDYTNRGAATTDDDQALQQMLGGKAAMAVAGPASLSALRAKFKDAAAVAKLPTISPAAIEGGTVGGTGVAFIVLKNSKRKQEAVDFIKHLLSAEEQKTFAESGEPGPLVGRTDAKGYYSDPLFNQLQAWGVEPSNTFWPDNTFSAELVNELSTQAQLTWNGKLTAKQFLAKLDQKRDSLG